MATSTATTTTVSPTTTVSSHSIARSTPPPPTITNRSASNVSSPPRQQALECDYDVNPTYLYQAIEAREWDHAKEVFTKSTAHTQVATWVTRKEVNGKLRWRLLPIHAAIIFKSPLEIVELLLQEHPEGSQCKDDQGMLPLHLAFRNGSDWDILEELLISNPQAIAVKDRKGRTPVQCAISATKKQASVLELYTQISLSSERQRSVHESRSILEARVSALQNAHVQTLTSLKDECQDKIRDLEQCLLLKEEELVSIRQEVAQSRETLEAKESTEQELTEKLEEVSRALEAVSKMRAANDTVVRKKYMEREKVLKEANDELLLLVQSLLDQQTSVKVSLDKQSWEAKEKLNEVESIVHNVTNHHKKMADESEKERDMWRTLLEESNRDASDRLSRVLEKTRLLGEEEDKADVESTASYESSLPGLEKTRPIGSSSLTTDEKQDEMVITE